MTFMKSIKKVDENFEQLFVATYHYRHHIHKTALELVFNCGFALSNRILILEWFPPQDRYCFTVSLYNDKEFIINSYDSIGRLNYWNEDFKIEFDIERSFFDCLLTVYPMPSNFKYEHLKVLKSIATKYMEKKIQYKIK